jgi:hypothetical protein
MRFGRRLVKEKSRLMCQSNFKTKDISALKEFSAKGET